MVFSGAVFLYAFLPLTLAVYALAPQRGRNAVLLIASLLFYAFGEPVYVFLLLLSSVSDWALSLCIERRRGTRTAKLALAVSVLLNLGLLGFFKYADFFLTTVNGLFGLSPAADRRAPAAWHQLLYVPDHELHHRRLPRARPAAAEPRDVRHVRLPVPAAHRRADRPLFRYRGRAAHAALLPRGHRYGRAALYRRAGQKGPACQCAG